MDKPSEAAESSVFVESIGQIAMTVSDLARARVFYANKLGMKHLFDAGSMAFFQCGEIRFAIGLSEESGASAPHGGPIIYFHVSKIDAVHAALKEQGVEFLQAPHLVARMPDHELWLAFLKDPDGNVLGLMSEVPLA